jgi:polysaccharide deacetylase family protein (PEP-CTERM system associated)
MTSLSERPTTHFFSVDVEEYFQVNAFESIVSRDRWLAHPSRVARSVDELLEMLSRRGVRGTFFTLGWIARHRPHVVRAIAAAGHEIASHGFWHQRVPTLSASEFREDVRQSKALLEDVVGVEVLGYRAPSFSIIRGTEWALDVLIEEGYRYDSSLFPIRRRGYGYASACRSPHWIQRASGQIAEFPLATLRYGPLSIPAAGGGYLRQFPLAVIRRAFADATARCEPATFYVHPWEIDDGQPRLAVSALTRMRHYRGLRRTHERIDALLREFNFDCIASHLEALDGPVRTLELAGVA